MAAAATDAGDSASITNTLTMFNASLAAITVADNSTIGDAINNYVQTVAVVSTTVLEAIAEGTSIANALADSATVDAQTALAATQVEISDQATLIQVEIVAAAAAAAIDVVIEIEVIPTTVPEIEIDLGDIIIPTGATGAAG